EYFKEPVKPEDIVWHYSGVRPLYDDGATAAQEATRDYVLRVDGESDEPAAINIFGGKITTYRKLSESVLEHIQDLLGSRKAPWTKQSTLPGGDFAVAEFDSLVEKLTSDFPFLASSLAERFVRSYGTRAWLLLEGAQSSKDMGADFGHSLSEREVTYLMQHEWAECAEDILWRRSKLGVGLGKDEILALDEWISNEASFTLRTKKQREI
ncbi:MAG: glycerol-3-phosphate dehydrogenase C-terminal domain-containing protein, partial [Hyphomicrobiales bacterium]